MRIRVWHLALIVLVFIFGGIGISSITGSWQTTSTKIPATYTSGDFAGQYNPADIRGSYTFGEISDTFKIPLNDLTVAFSLESQPAISEFQVKSLESLYIDAATGNSVGTESVRLFVALYKGLPITLADSDYLLPPAIQILKEKAVLTIEQVSFLDSHILQPAAIGITATTSAVASPATAEATHTPTVGSVTGKTTFQELLDWGLTEGDIESLIGEKLPSKSTAVRDYASQKGLDFTTLKAQLQTLIDSLKK
jgi:hypothetical protein